MQGINTVFLLGNVGGDIQVRHTRAGVAVANVQFATNGRKDEEGDERVDWHRLVFYGNKALLAQEYVSKGDMLHITGRIQYSTYDRTIEFEDGTTQTVQWPTTDIWVLDVKFLTPKAPEGN